jgi:hypothetical protein
VAQFEIVHAFLEGTTCRDLVRELVVDPNLGQYPLVVDPVIGNARFSKALMDGGSSLNILYAHTLRLLGIRLDQLRPSTTPFHGVAPGKRVQPLG